MTCFLLRMMILLLFSNNLQSLLPMKTKILLSLLLFLSISDAVLAQSKKTAKGLQVPCRFISEPTIYGTNLIKKDQKYWSLGMDKKLVKEVLAGCDSLLWPLALRTETLREPNLRNLQRYTMNLIARYAVRDRNYTLVQIPAAANSGMPIELRPAKNIYLLVSTASIFTDRTYSHNLDGPLLPFFSEDDFYPGKRVHCRIVNRGELYSTYDVSDDTTWHVYVEDYEKEDIENYSSEGSWPEKLQTLELREKYNDYFKYFNAYAIAVIKGTSSNKYIIQIPAYENEHMPEGLMPETDIYMVIGEDGIDLEDFYDEDIDGYPDPIEEELAPAEEPPVAPEEDPVEEVPAPAPVEAIVLDIVPGNPVKVYIVDRGEMYSSLDISSYETELKPFLTKPFEYVKTNCKEESWPEGINTLDERDELNAEFRLYNVKAIAKFDSNYFLLEVNPEDNKHMPAAMQPTQTMYFVIGPKGISLTAPAK